LGLARVLVQTASGNAGAEMTLEGLKEFEAVRDFLYTRMRGVKEPARQPADLPSPFATDGSHELAAILREVTHELRGIRLMLESRTTRERDSTDV
jgi:putative membrane protein